MTDFIKLLFIGICWIWGVNFLFKKKEILGYFGELMRDNLPKWFVKPTIGCPACMSSVHGTLIYFCASYFLSIGTIETNLIFWPFYCVCLVGISHIIIEHLYDTSEEN